VLKKAVEKLEAFVTIASKCLQDATRSHLMFYLSSLLAETLVKFLFQRAKAPQLLGTVSGHVKIFEFQVGPIVRSAAAAVNRFGQFANVVSSRLLDSPQRVGHAMLTAISYNRLIVVVELHMLPDQGIKVLHRFGTANGLPGPAAAQKELFNGIRHTDRVL